MGQIRKTYTQDFKYQVVKMYAEEGKSSYELSRNLDIYSGNILRWVRAYREHGISALGKKRGVKGVCSRNGKNSTLSLNSRVSNGAYCHFEVYLI